MISTAKTKWVRSSAMIATVVLLGAWVAIAQAGNNGLFRQNSVGGVSITANGEMDLAKGDVLVKMVKLRRKLLEGAPAGLSEKIALRKVSLRKLQAALEAHHKQIPIPPIPDTLQYLGGLQRIKYVFVYPEQNDIVLVGPGEGWKINDEGVTVGVTTGRPVLMLDDLLVSLRAATNAKNGTISCSIDPTAEGLKKLRTYIGKQRQFTPSVIAGIEKALGSQTISVNGLPGHDHFTRTIVAADFQMKRLAMGFEKSPVAGMPDFMTLIKGSPKGLSNMMPRWWLTTNYEPFLQDKEGLAWELRGQGVKVETEEDFLKKDGTRKRGVAANPSAKKWADAMTAKYDELSQKMSIFAELRNCMDMAVVSALIIKQDMPGKAGLPLTFLLNEKDLMYTDVFNPPKKVASKARMIRKGRGWLITASGGVKINAFAVAGRSEAGTTLAPHWSKAEAAMRVKTWWSN
jgi:hypothetical protein